MVNGFERQLSDQNIFRLYLFGREVEEKLAVLIFPPPELRSELKRRVKADTRGPGSTEGPLKGSTEGKPLVARLQLVLDGALEGGNVLEVSE